MSRDALIDNIISMLIDADFIVSEQCIIRPKSFDLAARRGNKLFLIKILGNVDAFNRETAIAMHRLSGYLNAKPLVIALYTRDKKLDPGVVYFRHGISVLGPQTAYDLFIEGTPPLIYAAPGGLYVPVNGDNLALSRKELGWSLGKLAMTIGVSRRTVSKYENGMDASIEVAIRLEDLFGSSVTIPIDISEHKLSSEIPKASQPINSTQEDIAMFNALSRFGFIVHPTSRAPFQTVSEHSSDSGRILITGHSHLTKTAIKRARIMGSISHVTQTQSVYFVDKIKQNHVQETVLIEHDELKSLDCTEDLNDLIQERMY
jgi:putative transcriptional regulator